SRTSGSTSSSGRAGEGGASRRSRNKSRQQQTRDNSVIAYWEVEAMRRDLHWLTAAGALLAALFGGQTALAQKQGGVLKVYFFDSPASMSIHEETTAAGEGPIMGVFNNLVLYKQDVPQSSLQSIVPDLASDWSWDEDKTQLTFRLREGVKWHDGKPFTAKDVQCTWDLLTGKTSDKL